MTGLGGQDGEVNKGPVGEEVRKEGIGCSIVSEGTQRESKVL